MSGKSGNKQKAISSAEINLQQKKIPAILTNLTLLLISALLFAFSFPSFINTTGFAPLALIALFPAFAVIYRIKFLVSPLYGLFLGLVSYAIFNYWLSSFHPLTIFIVPLLYAFYYLVLFPFLKISDKLFLRKSYIVNTLIWVGYEYLRTKGFLGYPYGIIGYTQYLFTPLVRFSSLFGIWGVSLLVVFPSAFLGYVYRDGFSNWLSKLKETVKQELPVLICYAVIFASVISYGFISKIDTSQMRQWKVALIQQNIDPWQGGWVTYNESLIRLKRQSLESTKENPEIIIWSETSFVPAIDFHTRHRPQPHTYELVKELKDFLASQEIPYLIGNDEGVLVVDENREEVRIDYNSTLLYHKGELKGTYRKMHLVPFTEHFPYKKQLPFLHKLLVNADTHFWEKGKQRTVFEVDGVKFATPICFEDTFGYISREFVREGAEVIVNMTNDSWSGSVAAEVQHMAHAVFRAAENRKSLVRSTNGGITCIIDPNGEIISRIAPFEENYLTGYAPVNTGSKTLYTKIGDFLPVILIIISLILITGKFIIVIFIKQRQQS